MKKVSSIVWGLILITLGVILGGNALGIFDINVFFDGWWTLFIIVPCTVGLITDSGERTGHLIGLVVGVCLLLACQNVVSFGKLWQLLLPAIVIIIGVSMICKNVFSKKFNEAAKKLNEKINDGDETAAVFSGQNINMAGEEFKGRNISAVFGGLKLDLREAKIKEDVIINASAVFGGIEIWVPDDMVVKIKSNSFFGGVSDKRKVKIDEKAKSKKPTIYINGMALFGGVEIK